ncbi:hypothetical protein EWE75_20805 [Sphingomonas populi]|uniref:Uncharacterized protein n=1 Tax=Sphingomonas populi TaxID=2484750 RepID=A0A4Q6XTE7_9SPHN|nr:hypothetical protein [Sphingomonas populi]RZF60852.1 hypothetical protein EWE75_20805 [Sphingomonas populi]
MNPRQRVGETERDAFLTSAWTSTWERRNSTLVISRHLAANRSKRRALYAIAQPILLSQESAATEQPEAPSLQPHAARKNCEQLVHQSSGLKTPLLRNGAN